LGYDIKDLFKDVKKVGAPVLGTVLEATGIGGPIGKIVTDILGIETNGKSDTDIASAIGKAIEKDPAAAAKLVEIERTHTQRLQEIALDEAKAYLLDMQSAREREVSFMKFSGGRRDIVKDIIGATVIAAFVVSVILPYFIVAPAGSEIMIGRTQGILGTLAVTVVQFYYGSSASSVEKTKILANGGSK